MVDPADWNDSATAESSLLRWVLVAAGIYNLVWGAWVVLFPNATFHLLQTELPRYPQIWQCVGMIVGVYGIGYLIAARDPFRHWPIVLVGLLGKLFGPIGFLMAATAGDLPWAWGGVVLLNDVIWWLPFTAILYQAVWHNGDTSIGNPHDIDEVAIIFPSQRGQTLAELSHDRPLMIVFLRHFGCTFCREALADLARTREALENHGVTLALVHMSPPGEADAFLKQYGLDNVHHFSDANCEIYRAFGLDRARLRELFVLPVWWRGMVATLRGHIIGTLWGDGFRMPGIFFMFRSEICGSLRHRHVGYRPDYVHLADEFHRTFDQGAVA